jgi:peptidoglycan/LPS O-acetylase OafA/YrhL
VPELAPWMILADTGYLAVDLFFVLSGFILSYQYAEKYVHGSLNYTEFLVKRLARIYPVHLFTILILVATVVLGSRVGIVIADSGNFSVWGATQDLLLIRGWIAPSQGWNFPAWSLSAEWLAYLCFPAVCAAIVGLLVWSKKALLIGFCALSVTFAAATAWLPSFNEMPHPAIRVLVAFAGGVALHQVSLGMNNNVWRGWMGFVALLMLVVATPFIPSGPVLATSGLFLCLAVVLFLATGGGGAVRFLSSRVMVYGGRISFSIYMVHGLALMAFVRLFPVPEWSDDSLAVRVTLIAVQMMGTVALGAVVYHLVEHPAQKLIVARWLRRKKLVTSAASESNRTVS